MIPKAKDLKIGEWVDVSKSYHKKNKQTYLELRLKDINKCIGKAYLSPYGGHVRALFSTESDSISKVIPLKSNIKFIHSEWEILMNELLEKMFQ